MIIEDTISEITEFIIKFRNTIRLLVCTPKKLLIYLRYDRYLSLLKAPVFFLIAYFSFLCVHLSNDKGKGVGDRLGYDQLVVNLKELPEHLTEVERFLYLTFIFALIYYLNVLISVVLLRKKEERGLLQQIVLYYASLNILCFVLIEVGQLIIGDKLAAIIYNSNHLSIGAFKILLDLLSYGFWTLKYVAVPLLYLLLVCTIFEKKKVTQYLVPLIFIIYAPDLIIALNKAAAVVVDPKSGSVLLKGNMIGPSSDYISFGNVRPVFMIDSVKKASSISFDLYLYNNTDSLLIVPLGDTLSLRTEMQRDFDNLHTKLSISDATWDKFDHTPYVFYAGAFESKSDRYQVIKPEEVKWVSFTRVFKSKQEAVLFRAFFCGCAKLAQLKIYRPSVNNRVSSQIWIPESITQELIFTALVVPQPQ